MDYVMMHKHFLPLLNGHSRTAAGLTAGLLRMSRSIVVPRETAGRGCSLRLSPIQNGGAPLQQTHQRRVMWMRNKHPSSENANLADPKVVQML